QRGSSQVLIVPMPHQLALEEARQSNSFQAILFALASAIAGFLIAWFLVLIRPDISGAFRRRLKFAFQFSERGWYIDDMYEYVVEGTVLFTARMTRWFDENILDAGVNLAARLTVLAARITGWFDRYVVDGIVTLVGATVQFFGLMTRSVQTGRIQTYLAWVV